MLLLNYTLLGTFVEIQTNEGCSRILCKNKEGIFGDEMIKFTSQHVTLYFDNHFVLSNVFLIYFIYSYYMSNTVK